MILLKQGQLLRETERQKPGEYQRLHDVTVAPTLSELGLTKRESAEAQMLAALPEETFEAVKAGDYRALNSCCVYAVNSST